MKIRGKRGVVTLSHCVLHTFALTGHKLNILNIRCTKYCLFHCFSTFLGRVNRSGQVFNNDIGQGENMSLLFESESGSERLQNIQRQQVFFFLFQVLSRPPEDEVFLKSVVHKCANNEQCRLSLLKRKFN